MKFSELLPQLHGTFDSTPARPLWDLSFCCPLCHNRTSVRVTGNPPVQPVWQLTPAPLDLLNSIQAGEDIMVQWNRLWDSVTIAPSMQQLPHARQVNCSAHFTVLKGEIIQ